jgi:hypothetical protein
MVRRLLCSAACALLLSAGLGGVAQAQSTGPTVSGPVTGGKGVPIVFSGQPADALVGRESFDLASVGYTQEEFFLDGTASAYSPAPGTTLTADGRWTVEPTSEADYTTRVVVNRPLHRRDFNGTVVVEWLNATSHRSRRRPGVANGCRQPSFANPAPTSRNPAPGSGRGSCGGRSRSASRGPLAMCPRSA